MNAETQQPASEPEVESPVIEPKAVPTTPKKSNEISWIVAGTVIAVPWIVAGIVIAVLCLCSILCVALVAAGVGKVMVEMAPVEATLDTLMRNMEAKDVESAFALFSPRAQRQMSITDLEELTEGNDYRLFEGYESISLQNIELLAAGDTDPDMPQGTVANVTAIVFYADGFTGDLTAVLEKVDGKWRLFSFDLNVPADKFQAAAATPAPASSRPCVWCLRASSQWAVTRTTRSPNASGSISGTVLWSVYGIFGGQDTSEFTLTLEEADSACETSRTVNRKP